MSFRKKYLLKFLNYWPPFLGAGIQIETMSKDYKEIEVSLKMRFWNRNYVNTHYGGSLYSMTDPFYMLMLIQLMGPEYIIWDKAATIKFKKPGIGKVRALFQISDDQIKSFKKALDSTNKIEPILIVLVKDESQNIIAEVEKTLYIKKKH